MNIKEIRKKYSEKMDLTEEKIRNLYAVVDDILSNVDDTIINDALDKGTEQIWITKSYGDNDETSGFFCEFFDITAEKDFHYMDCSEPICNAEIPYLFSIEIRLFKNTFYVVFEDEKEGFKEWFKKFEVNGKHMFDGKMNVVGNYFEISLDVFK